MRIAVIDWRGDGTAINSRGDSLFNYRTKYFHRQQEDFARWQLHGHTLHCFTQHDVRAVIDDWWAFDEVIPCTRASQCEARNQVLAWATPGEWIGCWDNDATLNWHKMWSADLPDQLEFVCEQAQDDGIGAWMPFNAQQSPYPKLPASEWLFEPTIKLKGTMMFLAVTDVRFDEDITCWEEVDYATQLMMQGVKTARLQQAALRELVEWKSTLFDVNCAHPEYGARPLMKNQNKWDTQWSRQDAYAKAKQQIEAKWHTSMRDLAHKHKQLWRG